MALNVKNLQKADKYLTCQEFACRFLSNDVEDDDEEGG